MRLAKALFNAYFGDNVNIGEPDNVIKVAATVGLTANINDQAVKDKTRAEVDGEPFWGLDRFDQIDRWLKAPF